MSSNRNCFALVDKNLLNYPIARDSRTSLNWVENKAKVPENSKIELSFPADAERRCPNGFDVNVLLFLLSEVRKQGQSTIIVPSLSVIVKALGLGTDGNANLRRVRDALTLWSTISIKFENYYHARKRNRDGTWRKGHNEARRFPPPISACDMTKQELRISIREAWRPCNKYVQRVPLPLPMHAVAQNAILAALVSIKGGKPRKLRRFCRKIGLNHSTRRRVLDHALRIAEQYFKRNSVFLYPTIKDRLIAFGMTKPVGRSAERRPSPEATEPTVRKTKPIERIKMVKRVDVRSEPIRIEGCDWSGRRCHWWRQPDGRETEDYDGRKLIE
jgi:hypothetical protein